MLSDDNPFATRRTRPGELAYVFPPGQTPSTLVERLRRQGWRGQIVGPHGSGKSSLLAVLVRAIAQAGRRVRAVELHDGQRRLPLDLRRDWQSDPFDVLVIDGYEQLSRLSRMGLQWFCRRRRLGLLVTSHADAGLAELARTCVSIESARAVVEQLLGRHGSVIAGSDVEALFARHGGNMRELLMDLYDLYEERRTPR